MYRLSNTFPTVYFFQEEDNSYVAIFHFPRRNEKILRTYHLILPKFHLILPKKFSFPPEEMIIFQRAI